MLIVVDSPVHAFGNDHDGCEVIETGVVTTNTEFDEFTAPQVPVTTTRYVPASDGTIDPMVREDPVAPEIALKLAPDCFCH